VGAAAEAPGATVASAALTRPCALSATKALVRGLCQKFDVANRTGVAIRAIELGL
jgi:DNA-binding NarL/FixJ family response regulator